MCGRHFPRNFAGYILFDLHVIIFITCFFGLMEMHVQMNIFDKNLPQAKNKLKKVNKKLNHKRSRNERTSCDNYA